MDFAVRTLEMYSKQEIKYGVTEQGYNRLSSSAGPYDRHGESAFALEEHPKTVDFLRLLETCF